MTNIIEEVKKEVFDRYVTFVLLVNKETWIIVSKIQGGSAWGIARKLMKLNQVQEKHKNYNFSFTTFTTVF